MKKILFNWKYLILFGAIILIGLYMIYSGYIFEYLNYNIQSSEDGISTENLVQMRNKFFLGNIRFDLNYTGYNGIKHRVALATIIATIFILSTMKRRLLKYNIGRNEEYNKEMSKLKYRLSFITPIVSLLMVLIILFIGIVFSSEKGIGDLWSKVYHPESIFGFIKEPHMVLVVVEIMSFLGLYIISLLSYEIVDRYDVFKGIIIIFLIYLLIPILVTYLPIKIPDIVKSMPSQLINFNNFMVTDPLEFIIPAIMYIGITFWIRKLEDKNIEIE